MSKRDVFSLESVYEIQINNQWSVKTDVWLKDNPFFSLLEYGYFGGGRTGGNTPISTVDRIDYANDTATASVRGPLSLARWSLTATGNNSFGYFGGGSPGPFSTVDRVDYINDMMTASVRGSLSASRYGLAATGNSSFGYFGGGAGSGGAVNFSIVDRVDYTNDIISTSPRGPLTFARGSLAATGNSSFGYFGAGFTPGVTPGAGPISTVDRIDYSNDTATASVRGSLSSARYSLAATGNSNYGYFGAGSSTKVDRIDYSNDTVTASPRGPLISARYRLAATGNGSFGYFGGGQTPGPVIFASLERIDYFNDTVTALVRGSLSLGKTLLAASSPQANGISNPTFIRPQSLKITNLDNPSLFTFNAGYFGGGFGFPSSLSTVDRIDYSNDTATASVRGPLSVGKEEFSATGNSNYGWFGGGSTNPGGGPVRFTSVDRIDYANDTTIASSRGPLSLVRDRLSATGNSNYGWFGGGANPFTVSRVDRIDYANDTATAPARGSLPDGRNRAATGNSNYGWFGGGDNSPTLSTVNRIDYANDTVTTSIRGPLSLTRYLLAATGNSNYGWFGAGGPIPTAPNFTIVDRIDYSNDTVTASVRGSLTLARIDLAATGNSNYGWFGGGNTGVPTLSTVDRIDFANDTVTAAVRGLLSQSRSGSSATSSQANGLPQLSITLNNPIQIIPPLYKGYFAGGISDPITLSTVNRIDYSNDTATASVRGPLSTRKVRVTATGNSNYGWFAGGSEFNRVSTVDRIDYSNDTATASVRGTLSTNKEDAVGTGNNFYGYFGGGDVGTIITVPASVVERIDYANDTATASIRGPLSLTRYGSAATGNSNYGWFMGAEIAATASWSSTVDRIDYSNDTATASIRGPLSLTRGYLAATGNSNYGWASGGYFAPLPSAVDFTKSRVDRIDYSNDTTTTSIRGPLSARRYKLAATGNSSFGYFGSGTVNFPDRSFLSTVDRIDYSNDTAIASPRGTLTYSFYGGTATSATANGLPQLINFLTFINYPYGYFGGGRPSGTVSTVDRIDYSNDTTTASPRGSLSLARTSIAATGNSSFGYFGAGSAPGPFSTVDRIDYANDTATASVRGSLSIETSALGAVGNSFYGYFAGGLFTLSTVNRVDYSNDTVTASVRGPLSYERGNLSATGNSNYGWFGSSNIGGRTTVDRIDYANDTVTASVRGSLSSARQSLGATGNSDYGWFGGGFISPNRVSTVDRIDYSNDTATASPRGPLSIARNNLAATGNSSFGYFGGGDVVPAATSIVDRIDYSNDTATASPRGNLTSANRELSATSLYANGLSPEFPTSNIVFNYGYFGGGLPSPVISTLDRIDYSNDTATVSVRGALSIARNAMSATGNYSYGYFAGGFPGGRSLVDRIDYSNDILKTLSRGLLSIGRGDLSSTGNNSYGWFGGGFTTLITVSTVDRIDYSNDTDTASVRGPLSIARYSLTATGNSNYGYFGGGTTATDLINILSRVDRIDYSNDTATASVRGPLSEPRFRQGSTGNSNYGWYGGGRTPTPGSPANSIRSNVDRIDYSNDTTTASPRGPLSSARTYLTATGNSSYGWFGGGFPAATSLVDRIDYSNDTIAASPRGSLSTVKYSFSSTSAAENLTRIQNIFLP